MCTQPKSVGRSIPVTKPNEIQSVDRRFCLAPYLFAWYSKEISPHTLTEKYSFQKQIKYREKTLWWWKFFTESFVFLLGQSENRQILLNASLSLKSLPKDLINNYHICYSSLYEKHAGTYWSDLTCFGIKIQMATEVINIHLSEIITHYMGIK